MRPRTRIAPYLWVLTMLAISCDVSTLLSVSPAAPTTIPTMVDTLVVTSASAGSTQTALLISSPATPSPIPLPTYTPSLTPTRTPTFLFRLTPETSTAIPPGPTATSGGSASGELSCKLLSQSMRNGKRFDPRENFEMGWKVTNNGTADWDPSSVDFRYLGGTRMYLYTPTHLQTAVAAGDTVALGASMVAPRNSGTYTTIWTLRRGTEDFCRVSVTIVVR